MEQHPNSVVKTPINSVAVQRRRKSKSYRQSYRSCLSAASHFGFTPVLTGRRLNSSRRAPRSQDVTAKADPDQLALLMKTEWHLSYVTPLYHFRYTQLNTYSRQLSAFLAAEKQKGLAVEVEGSHNGFRASFSVVQGMVDTYDDAEMVFVQIHSKDLFAKRDDPQKVVWRGWLACIHGNPEYLRSLPKDFVCLPLFGSSGPEFFTSSVKSWFCRTFDCCFGPLEINHSGLQWLAGLWTDCHTESNTQQLKMTWTLPAVPPLRTTYAVDPQDAWDLWSSVRKLVQGETTGAEEAEEGSSIDIKEVTQFMAALKSHFYRHFRLDLSAGNLTEVSTAQGTATGSGRIKISNSRYIITVLTLLTECALLKMPI